jgi:hypothetical protein
VRGKTVLLFWVCCVIASLFGFPRLWFEVHTKFPISLGRLFASDLMIEATFSAIACYIGFKMTPKTDLKPFLYLPWMKRTIFPSLIAGTLMGGAVFLLDRFILHSSLSTASLPSWSEFSYGVDRAVNGTAILRFCLFTSLYFLICKWFSSYSLLAKRWIANIGVALPFAILLGLGSLHLEFSIHDAIWRAFLFSGAPNLIFGSLYWSRGIGATIGASIIEKWVTEFLLFLLPV